MHSEETCPSPRVPIPHSPGVSALPTVQWGPGSALQMAPSHCGRGGPVKQGSLGAAHTPAKGLPLREVGPSEGGRRRGHFKDGPKKKWGNVKVRERLGCPAPHCGPSHHLPGVLSWGSREGTRSPEVGVPPPPAGPWSSHLRLTLRALLSGKSPVPRWAVSPLGDGAVYRG